MMMIKNKPDQVPRQPPPVKPGLNEPIIDPEEVVDVPTDDPDILPDEETEIVPPYEEPPPGEGP